jgi:hypothetical protein
VKDRGRILKFLANYNFVHNKLTGIKMKVLRSITCIGILLSNVNLAYALCDQEFNAYISAYRQYDPGGSQYISKQIELHKEFSKANGKIPPWDIASSERVIKESKGLSSYRSNPSVRANVAELEYGVCIKRARRDLDQSSGIRNDSAGTPKLRENTLNQPQQSPQHNQVSADQAGKAAQQNQARADQQRQDKRKTNDPAAQAHECVDIDKVGSGNFGAFKNTCNFKVNFSTCNYKPRTIQGGFNWSADFDCEKNQFGLHTPDGGRSVAAHNRNTEMVYWFACKAPATPVDAVFVVGKGIEARCHN